MSFILALGTGHTGTPVVGEFVFKQQYIALRLRVGQGVRGAHIRQFQVVVGVWRVQILPSTFVAQP